MEQRCQRLESLAGLANVELLFQQSNEITDLTPLSGLVSLADLRLDSNQISNLQALVDNEELGPGDEVSVLANPLSEDSFNTHIPQLEARGVFVLHDWVRDRS